MLALLPPEYLLVNARSLFVSSAFTVFPQIGRSPPIFSSTDLGSELLEGASYSRVN